MNTEKQSRIVCIAAALVLAAGFLLCIFLPKAEYSDSERRKLAAKPEFSLESVWSGRFMDGFEDYAVDTFPMREQLKQVQALSATKIFLRGDNHGIYETDGYLAAIEYPMDEASLDRAVDRFRYICERYLTEENRVYFSVIPDKGCFLAERSGHPVMDYAAFETYVAERAEFAEYISIRDLLEAEDYYRTDTHWRQERIIDVADRLMERMGAEPASGDVSGVESVAGNAMEDQLQGVYEMHELDQDFYGVYYGQASLPMEPDGLYYLTSPVIDQCRAYDWQNGREIPVYDLARADGKDPYELFLSGPLSLVTIENPEAGNGRKLVLFRDSFGASIAPLLAGGYEEIILVDIRYIHLDLLGQFVDFEGCDVLFLYSTLVLNNSETMK